MSRQLLANRGFENELNNFIAQGFVSMNSEIAHSGTNSAQLLSSPSSIAEISQVVFFILPGAPVKFSFYARKILQEDVTGLANLRAEVSFLSSGGMAIPPGIVISVRGRDLGKNKWNYYEEYGYAPYGTVAALVDIRLEPPADGKRGLLIDDLALVAEAVTPLPPPVYPVAPDRKETD